MRNTQTDRVLLDISIAAFFGMSVSFLLMPIEALKILPGLLFWGGLLTGAILQIVLENRRRAFFKENRVKRHKMQKPRNGLMTFSSNRAATVADILWGVSTLATIITLIITKGFGYICFAMVAVAIFAFCMHCILNGRIYFHVNNKNKVQQVLDEKKAKSKDKGEGENG